MILPRNTYNRLIFGLLFIFFLVTAFISLLPVLIILFTAFKDDTELTLKGFKLLPKSFTYFDNFKYANEMGNWLLYFKNSLFITFVTVVASLFFNSIAGYAFSRLEFRGKNILFVLLLAGMMVSPQSIIIPQYIMIRSVPFAGGNDVFGNGGFGLLDTYSSLIIPFISGSFGIFLCRQFYSSFPKALDEAARLEGCGPIRSFFSIYLPQSQNVLATLSIFKSVSTWNDFFYPLIMTQSENMKTVQLGLQMFRGSSVTHYNWLMAATLITIIPMIVVYLCAQKYFIQGISTSGMKD